MSGVIFFKVSQKVSQPKAENIPRKHILIRFFNEGITFPLNFIFQRQHTRILTSPLIVNVLVNVILYATHVA